MSKEIGNDKIGIGDWKPENDILMITNDGGFISLSQRHINLAEHMTIELLLIPESSNSPILRLTVSPLHSD